MARAALHWTVTHLTARDRLAVGIRLTTIEGGRYAGIQRRLTLIRDALSRDGVEFIDENGGGAGVRLRKPAHVRKPK